MNKEQKAAVVEEIAGQIEGAEAIFVVDYRGISVPGAAELRIKLRDADASFRIVKNSLTERAAGKAGTDSLLKLLDGPTALTFVRGDAATAAKAIADFARANGVLEFKGGLMDGQTLTVDEIKSIARLPARDVLYAQFTSTVAAPLTGLVRGLGNMISGFASQLQQIVDRGMLAPGEAPAPAEEPAAGGDPAAEEVPATEEAPAAEQAPAAEEAPAEEPAAAEDASAPEAAGSDEAPAEEVPAEQAEEPAREEADPAQPEPQADQADNEADASAAAEAKEEA